MALVQESAYVLATLTPRSAAVSLTGVTAGNTLIVLVHQTAAATRSYTAVSDIDGALTSRVAYNPGLAIAILELRVASAGNHTVTVTANTGSTNFEAKLIEVSALDITATPTTGTFADGADTTTHYSAAVGDIDTTGAGFLVSAGTLGSASGVSSTTADTGNGWAKFGTMSSDIRVFSQYLVAGAARADERGAWTHGATSRSATCAIAFFPAAAAPAADRVYPRITRRRLPGGLF